MVTASQRLAKALQEAAAPASLCARAQAGYYDDFQSPLPFPKIALVDACSNCGMIEFCERVILGEFDSTREEAEQWFQEKRKQLRLWKGIIRDAEKRNS